MVDLKYKMKAGKFLVWEWKYIQGADVEGWFEIRSLNDEFQI